MLTSAANERIRRLRRLLEDPSAETVFAVEGLRALEEAVRSDRPVTEVYFSDAADAEPRAITLLTSLVERGAERVHVARALLERISQTERSQGLIGVLAKPSWSIGDPANGRPVFLLDGVRDPGNLGTMVRIADAFGLGGLYLSEDCVDLFNAKVVRSTMGSLFRVPVVRGPLAAAAAALRAAGYTVQQTAMDGATPLHAFRPRGPVAAILGNEAHGVRAAAAGLADGALRVEMPGHAESLNVAVTAGILAYEWTRPQ